MVISAFRVVILLFITCSAYASNIDFDLYLTTPDQSKSIHVSNNEIIPLEGNLQIKVYSKEDGLIDIFYESQETSRDSILLNPIEIKAGQVITIPSDEKSFKLDLSPGEVNFELAFKGESESFIKKTTVTAFDTNNLVKSSIRELINFTSSTSSTAELPVYEIDKMNTDYSALIEINNRVSNLVNNDLVLRGSSIFSKIAKGTVYIENYQNEEWVGIGSGILLNDYQIITNLHVIKDADTIYVAPYGEAKKGDVLDFSVHRAEILKIAEDKDLALIQTSKISDDINILEFISLDELEVGMNTHAVGHPDPQETWSYAKGYISGIRKNYETEYDFISLKADVIQNSTDIVPGFSGGPLTNDEGKIIGINSFGINDGFEYAVTTDEILEFLKITNNFDGWQVDDASKESKVIDEEFMNPKNYECLDTNEDGKDDYCGIDKDQSNYYEVIYVDRDYDGTFDELKLDMNENECDEIVVTIGGTSQYPDTYDKYYFDLEDDKSGYDKVGHDYNNDRIVDEYQTI